MKKLAQILLAIGFTAFTLQCAAPFVLVVQKQIAIAFAAERLEHANLQILHIPAHQLVWQHQHTEAKINNSLFDVKSYKIKNGIAILKGIFDTQEAAIEQQVKKLNEQQEQHQKQIAKKLQCNIFFDKPTLLTQNFGFVEILPQKYYLYNVKLRHRYTKPLPMPPWC
jgi:hypothetical protein